MSKKLKKNLYKSIWCAIGVHRFGPYEGIEEHPSPIKTNIIQISERTCQRCGKLVSYRREIHDEAYKVNKWGRNQWKNNDWD